MKQITTLALAAVAAIVLAVPAQAAGPATVDLQVEGASGAVVPTATVNTSTTPVNKDGRPGHDCTGTSAAGALELATGRDWSGTWFDGLGYSVERVRGESASFSAGRYFAFYVNGRAAETGVCGAELQAGDDVLLYTACAGATSGCFSGEPLYATAPRRVAPGERFTVRVREARTTFGADGSATTSLEPARGARVRGRTTGADGRVSIALQERGRQLVVVKKAGRPTERVPVCVTGEDDSVCAAIGRAVVRGRITSVREGRTYDRAPRLLRGTVPSAGAGVERIRLRLTRNDRGRCFTFDDDTERQRRLSRCGAPRGEWFVVGDRADWQYQLPFTLPRGRWVLDLEVRDREGRTSRLERGNTRVVFRVR